MSFSDYLENYVLNTLFGQESYWQPNLYLGLSRADPGEDESGLLEPTGLGYVRIQVDASYWAYATTGIMTNGFPISFPEAEDDWGVISHFALFDADYYDMMLIYGEVLPNRDVRMFDAPYFEAGQLQIKLT